MAVFQEKLGGNGVEFAGHFQYAVYKKIEDQAKSGFLINRSHLVTLCPPAPRITPNNVYT